MPGLLAFPASSDGAFETVASLIARTDPRRSWFVLALAALTAALDRVAVFGVSGAVYGQGDLWRVDLAVAVSGIAGACLIGRWARIGGLVLAERVSDTVLLGAVRRVMAADWASVGSDEPGRTLSRIATAMRYDASQAALALPAFLSLPVTGAWLAYHEPAMLPVIGVSSVAAAFLLRRDLARARAAQAVLEDAEATFEGVASSLLATRFPARLTGAGPAQFCGESLWPVVDDATRAASIHAEAHARVAGLLGWLGFLAVIVLLTFAPGAGPDREWMRALIVIAATVQPARQSLAAYLALKRVAAAASRIDAIAARFPADAAPTAAAPARWTTIAFRDVRVRERDTPDAYLAPIGPLDLVLRHGEIVALTGPNPHDRSTLLHLLCGLVPPDDGAILLDGRPIPAAMLRGLGGGALDREAPRGAMLPATGVPRADILLARFDLPAALLDPAAQAEAVAGLSGPERVRLAIVATELEDRAVRLYGDYTSGLDPRHRTAFTETLREARDRGRTCILTTGDADLIASADNVLLMQDGRLAAPGEAMP